MKKSHIIMLTMVLLMLVLSACNPMEQQPITSETEGFWSHFFVYPMSWLITTVAVLFNNNYGLSIILTTILIRMVLLPLVLKQQKSTRKMQLLRPEMQEIQERMKSKKGDPQAQQEVQKEMLSLYQKHGVNPLAGCLPILVQFPIIMAFYFAIIRTEEIRAHEFLWFNLGQPDYILPVVAAITTYFQFKMSMSQMQMPTVEGMPNPMNILLYIMPVMIVVAGITLPSALSLYWVIGNIFMIIQTYFVVIRPNLTMAELEK
ncbi:membrane protein insertase YidC [Alkalicoccobacillus porphyridii]|uniref:Membrane protein insertase YidC n=1 Tax=Alkalicoccobacillus porphyridii TaxID=2597270 RepID=A0A553ZU28_9BACI|nr:membrane protein insertase YidC [Alkalicoccobacillus porphyridii]TSB44980.1 membrane protein insertase YidC [Alkalicoccobacillus porphyridii]